MKTVRSLFLYPCARKIGTPVLQTCHESNHTPFLQPKPHWPELEWTTGFIPPSWQHNVASTLRIEDDNDLTLSAARNFSPVDAIAVVPNAFHPCMRPAALRPITGSPARPICFIRYQGQLLALICRRQFTDLGETHRLTTFVTRVWTRLGQAPLVAALCATFDQRNVLIRLVYQSKRLGSIDAAIIQSLGRASHPGRLNPARSSA